MLQALFSSLPRTNGEDVLLVVGYGAIGIWLSSVAAVFDSRASQIRHGHAALDQAFREGFVSISAMPPDNSTRNMFSEAEFQSRNCTSSIINVGRGGVINEKDSGTALRNRDIAGAATNVFEQWPATKSYSPLLDETILNLVLNPHVAWLSSKTIQCTIATAEPNIEGFVAGKPHNLA